MPRLPVLVRLSSERARDAVRQDCSFANKQESPVARLVVVLGESCVGLEEAPACRKQEASPDHGGPAGLPAPGANGHGDGMTAGDSRGLAGGGPQSGRMAVAARGRSLERALHRAGGEGYRGRTGDDEK
jgi:hypothetical protein